MRIILFLMLSSTAFSQSHADFRAALIAHEGYRLTPYADHLGHKTVGIGHKMLAHEPRRVWTPAEVESAFAVDLARAYHAALTEIVSYPEHSPAVRIVLVELAFQCGQTGLRGFKRFIVAINKKEYHVAAQELKRSRLARQTPGRVKSHIRVLTEAVKKIE